jgi:predicted ester cyclase
MATTTPPTTASNADVIRWSFEQLNRQDLSALRQLWTADTVERFPDRTCHGTDEIAAYLARWHLSATQEGRIQGIDGTGKRLELDGVDHFTLKDGKIASNFVIFDQMQWARHVGLLPPDGSAADRAVKAAFNAKTRVAKEIQARRSTS